jgi:hypothetical protein
MVMCSGGLPQLTAVTRSYAIRRFADTKLLDMVLAGAVLVGCTVKCSHGLDTNAGPACRAGFVEPTLQNAVLTSYAVTGPPALH